MVTEQHEPRGGAPLRSEDFAALFEAHARRVRRRLAVRSALSGAAIGLAVGAASALALWVVQRTGLAHPLHHPLARAFRPAFGALALVGAIAGWLRARGRAPSDEDVAVFLDERYAADEAITTAIGARRDSAPNEEGALEAVVVRRAATALERADRGALRLRPVQRRHALGPLLAGALVGIALLPVPAPPAPPPAPGTELVAATDVRGLDKVIEVASKIDPRDEAQRERLEKIANEAKALRDKARAGAPQREIQADAAKLAEQIAKERMSLGEGEERAGFEAAMRALDESGELDAAARALGDHDLAAFDQEMQKLANKSEKASREKAKEILKKAEEAARKAGAENVAKALAEQRKVLEQAEARNEQLRALSEAMRREGLDPKVGEQGRSAEKRLDQHGDPKAAKELAEALEKALGQMTDEEKQRLAKNLAKLAEQAGKSGAPDAQQLKELADSAKDPGELAKRLKELSEMELESPEAGRERELGGAEQQLGKTPVPIPGGPGAGPGQGNQPGKPGAGGPGNGDQPGEGDGSPGGDSTPGPSNKTKVDPSKKIDAGDLRSKADAKPIPGGTPGSSHTTRTGSRPGDTANRVGTGALGDAAPDEIGGVNQSDVPEPYKRHVGRYFQP